MQSKNNNIEIIVGNETDAIIGELIRSLPYRQQMDLEEPMKVSDFAFDHTTGFHYKYYRVNLDRGGPYIDFPDRIKTKNFTTIVNNLSTQ